MEFFAIAFSTFLGAAVALAGERLTRARDARLQEEAAINNLILDLAAKRAFLVREGDWDWDSGEVKRVVDSIFHARSLIRDARIALRPRSRALPHLREMTRACNNFIELSERLDEQHLKRALRRLGAEMTREVKALHSLSPRRILTDEPGSFALASA